MVCGCNLHYAVESLETASHIKESWYERIKRREACGRLALLDETSRTHGCFLDLQKDQAR